MIFLHNKIKNQTVRFPNINAIPEEYTQINGWEMATQSQIDAYNLSQVKTKAESILTTKRKEKQYESVTYNGKTYLGSQMAQNNLFQAYFIAKELKETALNWLDINNQKVILTLADALVLIKLLRDKINTLYIQEAEKQNIVKDAVNVSQIEAVLPAGSYTPSMPTNEAPDGAFNTQLEPANGLGNNRGGGLSQIQN